MTVRDLNPAMTEKMMATMATQMSPMTKAPKSLSRMRQSTLRHIIWSLIRKRSRSNFSSSYYNNSNSNNCNSKSSNSKSYNSKSYNSKSYNSSSNNSSSNNNCNSN